MAESLLIIEDDEDIALMVQDYLNKEGFNVLSAANGKEGLKIIKENSIDLVMLDVMMPVMDGYETLKVLREFSNVPVIMLTAKGEQMDKVIGFKKGCDDYMVKPFDLIELSLRIRAILRRGRIKNNSANCISYKDLNINFEEHKILKNNMEINFTKKEYDILTLLMKNQGRVYTSEMIYNIVWGEDYLENDNSVMTHIRNIREKLGDKVKNSSYIKTIWGVGYKVEKDF